MIQKTISKSFAFFFVIVLFCSMCSAFIPNVYSLEKTNHTHQSKIISELTKANIIYLGETHDSLADHQAQLEIIETLYKNNPKIVIALEMFQQNASFCQNLTNMHFLHDTISMVWVLIVCIFSHSSLSSSNSGTLDTSG